jgi:hypothetical protein
MAQSSEENAAEWYEKAAEQGDASAQNALATMYYIGKLLPQSFEKAKLWYERAVKQGNAKAQRGLAYLLFTVHIIFPNMLKDELWPVLDAPHTGGIVAKRTPAGLPVRSASALARPRSR